VVLRLGVALLLLSCALWVALLVVPFWPAPAEVLAAVAGALVLTAEVVWWVGVALIGPDAWLLARSHGWKRLHVSLWQLVRDGRRPTVSPPPS